MWDLPLLPVDTTGGAWKLLFNVESGSLTGGDVCDGRITRRWDKSEAHGTSYPQRRYRQTQTPGFVVDAHRLLIEPLGFSLSWLVRVWCALGQKKDICRFASFLLDRTHWWDGYRKVPATTDGGEGFSGPVLPTILAASGSRFVPLYPRQTTAHLFYAMFCVFSVLLAEV